MTSHFENNDSDAEMLCNTCSADLNAVAIANYDGECETCYARSHNIMVEPVVYEGDNINEYGNGGDRATNPADRRECAYCSTEICYSAEEEQRYCLSVYQRRRETTTDAGMLHIVECFEYQHIECMGECEFCGLAVYRDDDGYYCDANYQRCYATRRPSEHIVNPLHTDRGQDKDEIELNERVYADDVNFRPSDNAWDRNIDQEDGYEPFPAIADPVVPSPPVDDDEENEIADAYGMNDDNESVGSDGGVDRCCCCYEPTNTQAPCGHTICEGCFGSVRSVSTYQGHRAVRTKPCPCCRADMPNIIARPLTDAQKVRRYEELLAENVRLDAENVAQNVVVHNLRTNLTQLRLNTTAPISLVAGTDIPIIQPANNHQPVGAGYGNEWGGGGQAQHRQPRRSRAIIDITTTTTFQNNATALIRDNVVLAENQVLGDLTFDSRPRRRCEGNATCRANTRRVCSDCRAKRCCMRCVSCGCLNANA